MLQGDLPVADAQEFGSSSDLPPIDLRADVRGAAVPGVRPIPNAMTERGPGNLGSEEKLVAGLATHGADPDLGGLPGDDSSIPPDGGPRHAY